MKIKDFYKLCLNGQSPVIQMGDNIGEYLEESFDPKMIGRVISASVQYGDSYVFKVDMNRFEDYNKTVAGYDWIDNNGEPTLNWFESGYYPENGIKEIYFPMDIDCPFEIMSENKWFNQYLQEGYKGSYIEWLEGKLEELQK